MYKADWPLQDMKLQRKEGRNGEENGEENPRPCEARPYFLCSILSSLLLNETPNLSDLPLYPVHALEKGRAIS